MNKRNEYLTIGEVAKITDVGIKAIRYYEKINILKPAFIDPISGYRYYSIEQTHMINLIQICIKLNIPLKDLSSFIDDNENIDYAGLLSHGKNIMQEKIASLEKGLQFIISSEEKIKLAQNSSYYSRNVPEKIFYIIPYKSPLKTDEDIINKFFEFEWDIFPQELLTMEFEMGFMHEYIGSQLNRYAFIELPASIDFPDHIKTRTIPAGVYHCYQSERSQIEQAPEIFSNSFNKEKQFLVIETEAYLQKFSIYNPKTELRIIQII